MAGPSCTARKLGSVRLLTRCVRAPVQPCSAVRAGSASAAARRRTQRRRTAAAQPEAAQPLRRAASPAGVLPPAQRIGWQSLHQMIGSLPSVIPASQAARSSLSRVRWRGRYGHVQVLNRACGDSRGRNHRVPHRTKPQLLRRRWGSRAPPLSLEAERAGLAARPLSWEKRRKGERM